MEQNSLILVVNNLSQREQTREIFGQTERKMFTRIAAIKAENVPRGGDTGLFIILQPTPSIRN